MMQDERISNQINSDKKHSYILGLRDTRTNTTRWSFTKEKGQYSFEDNKKIDIDDFILDKEQFYFITRKEIIQIPRSGKVKYWQEVYKTFKENNKIDNVEMLPSYGMPIGEYQLVNEDDELVNTIPVFKFQLNSYERFLNIYFNDGLLNIDNIQDIKEKYFKEANNFIPITDRILNDLIIHITSTKERPEYIEYEFDKMNEIDDIIDNIAKELSNGKAYNLNAEYDRFKILHSVYSRKDFKREVESRNDILLGYDEEAGVIEEIPIEKLDLKRFNYVNEDDFNKVHNLEEIYKSASEIVCKNLHISELKNSPSKAQWTKKAYKSYFGMARGIDMYTKNINKDKSQIDINSILCSKDVPSYVIEFVLYHEMLHFELKMGHSKEFKKYEAMYPMQEEAEMILSEISDWLNYYWYDESIVNEDIGMCQNNIDDVQEKKSDLSSYAIFEKDKISNLKKLIKSEKLILLTKEELHEVYNNKSYKDALSAEGKYWFLSDDLKTSMNISDGKFHKVQNAYLIAKVSQ